MPNQRVVHDLHHQGVEQVDVHHAPADVGDFNVVAHGILPRYKAQQAARKAHNQLFGGDHGGGSQRNHRQRKGLDLAAPHHQQPEQNGNQRDIAADHQRAAFVFQIPIGVAFEMGVEPDFFDQPHKGKQQQGKYPLLGERDFREPLVQGVEHGVSLVFCFSGCLWHV